ncbi:MAG: transcription termination factor Rho [Desulfomonilaceae bacterium]
MGSKKKEKGEKKEKPLEDWTIKELREEALKIPNVQGVHGMNKQEIIEALRIEKGLPAPEKKKTESVRQYKEKAKALITKRDEERSAGVSRSRLNILRKKISKLKKKSRLS